jgi:hypothetical protein
LRQETVVPYLPENRIGETVSLSELKGPLATGQNARGKPFLVSFEEGAEPYAGSDIRCKLVSAELERD